MGGVVLLQRGNTPNNWSSTSDPTNAFDAGDGVRVGDYWYNTASGNVWVCVTNTVGAAVWRHVPRIMGMSHATLSHTGNTSETKLASVLIPAGAMGTTGRLEVRSGWTNTNSANTKTCRIRFGTGDNLSGTELANPALTTTLTFSDDRIIGNITASSQTSSFSVGAGTGGFGTAGAASVTSAIDTSGATYVVFSGQLASAGETVTLYHYKVILLRADIT